MLCLTVVLVLCLFSLRTLAIENCEVVPECHVFEWQQWSNCLGSCGFQSQKRERHMCCDASIVPQTIERCLEHCHKSSDFKLEVLQNCVKCENGGSLIPSSNLCQCDNYHKGECCQDRVKCSDNPCKHGTCSDHSSSFVCTCEPGYKGIDCDTRKACSEGITCQSGGICQNGPNGFRCLCSKMFTGEFCEKPLTCNDSPCKNGGSCTNTGSLFQCKCPPTYTGDVCDEVTMCSSHPCLHGTCTDTPSGFSCSCNVKFTGAKCDTLIPCTSTPCQHGTCSDSPTGFVCTCNNSYTGTRCETGSNVKLLEVERTKDHLLDWLPYLGYALLTLALLAGVIVIGCVCLKCCRPFCVSKGNEEEEDEERDENDLRRFNRNSVIPVNSS